MAKQKITSNLALRGIFYFQILQNLSTVKKYGNSILPSGVTAQNHVSLTIIGNLAILYMDTVSIQNKKIGYNDICILPTGYKVLSTTDSTFKNTNGSTGPYTRTTSDRVAVYLTSIEETSVGNYLTHIFLVSYGL